MELRRLEAMVKEIHEEMLFLRTREEEMRDLNGEPAGSTYETHMVPQGW